MNFNIFWGISIVIKTGFVGGTVCTEVVLCQILVVSPLNSSQIDKESLSMAERTHCFDPSSSAAFLSNKAPILIFLFLWSSKNWFNSSKLNTFCPQSRGTECLRCSSGLRHWSLLSIESSEFAYSSCSVGLPLESSLFWCSFLCFLAVSELP